MAATLLVAALPSLARASSPGTITLSGTGDRSVLVRLKSAVTLDSPVLDALGGPAFGHLKTPYFGFAVTRLSDGQVVAGRVRSDFVERTLKARVDIPIGGSPVLDPGTYRVTLLGRGALRLILHTKDGQKSVSWRVDTPTAVHFDAGSLTPSVPGAPVVEHRTTVVIGPRTFVSYGSVAVQGIAGVTATDECLTTRTALSCLGGDPAPVGSYSTGLGGGSGAAGTASQPGQTPPGTYEALFQAAPTVDGATYGYVLLALD